MRKKLETALLFIFLLVFIILSIILFKWYYEGIKNRTMINEIKNTTYQITDHEVETFCRDDDLISFSTLQKDQERIRLFLASQPLKEQNSDYVGWIHIPGTNIDYPVLQNVEEPEFYLKRDFNKNKNSHGSIYLDSACILGYSKNDVIYGHHMKDGSMFADLDKYKTIEYYLSHSLIRFDTLYSMNDYQIVAVLKVPEKELEKTASFLLLETEDKFNLFQEFISSYQLYDTGITFTCDDSFLTLITCEYTYKNGRILVIAKRIQD